MGSARIRRQAYSIIRVPHRRQKGRNDASGDRPMTALHKLAKVNREPLVTAFRKERRIR